MPDTPEGTSAVVPPMTVNDLAAAFKMDREGPSDTPPTTETPAEQEAPVETETPADTPLKWTLDGEEFDEGTLREWKKSGLRQSDYTTKTTALAEERKQWEKERALQLEAHTSKLSQLDEALAAFDAEPDFNALMKEYENDPQGLAQRMSDLHRIKAYRQHLKAEKEKAQAELSQKREAELKALAEKAQERVFELLPEWKDEAKRKAEWEGIQRRVLAPLGLKSEEVIAVARPELFAILYEASEYRRLKDAPKPADVKPDPKLKPGSPKAPVVNSALQDAEKAFKKSGKEKDLAAVFRAERLAQANRS